MSSEQLRQLIHLRIRQAHETLHEAEILFEQSSFRGTVNRSYYAMFYSLLALLATKGLGTSKHSGAISLFDREFVKTGDFPRELSRSLHMSFDLRQTYDYGEILEIDQPTAEQTLTNAKRYISSIEDYLHSHEYLKNNDD